MSSVVSSCAVRPIGATGLAIPFGRTRAQDRETTLLWAQNRWIGNGAETLSRPTTVLLEPSVSEHAKFHTDR
jgi:hypothetical protein